MSSLSGFFAPLVFLIAKPPSLGCSGGVGPCSQRAAEDRQTWATGDCHVAEMVVTLSATQEAWRGAACAACRSEPAAGDGEPGAHVSGPELGELRELG